MSSSHLHLSHQKINFVKAETGQLKSTAEKNKVKLDGNEVRAFYESVIQETTTGKSHQVLTSHSSGKVCSVTKNVTTKPADNKCLIFSERDIRIFLRAVNENDTKRVKEYLDKGMNVNATDCFNWSSLLIAAAEGHEDMVELLLENGADANYECGTYNAVGLANRKKKYRLAKLIDSYRNPKEPESGPSSSQEQFYCELCEIKYSEQPHETSIVHIVNQERRPDRGFAYDIPINNIGYSLLKKKGWTEEFGLGKQGQGRQYPVKTILKRDKKGLGVEKLPMKVTHFKSLDSDAVKQVEKKRGRRWHIKELHQQIDRKKIREERIRRMLNAD